MPGNVVIFHPSVAPFVQQAARALHEAKCLERLYTTLADRPGNLVQRLAGNVARLSGYDLRSKMVRRRVTEIPAELVTSWPGSEILRLSAGAFDRSGRLTDAIWERAENYFSRKVGRELRPDLKGIYGYEFSSRHAFTRAAELGLKIFYDVPAPETRYVEALLAIELARFPGLKTSYTRHTAAREARRTEHRRAEWTMADVVIAASEFTKKSFGAAGLDVSKILVIPYGAPPVAERESTLRADALPRKFRFVWAGTFSVRKGAHYLLEAWRERQLDRFATLDIYGSVTLPDELTRPVGNGITYHGPIGRDALLSHFRQSDALVFPTLCDGFGMVMTEAWSQGLPVITTNRAGASDLLREGVNGFLIPPADSNALGNQLESCIADPERLAAMREGALETAGSWQWSDYRKRLGELVLSALKGPI